MTLVNVFLGVFFDFFSLLGAFIDNIDGPLINVFLRVYFDGFWCVFFFRVFICIIGGTPDKRISEGLFRRVVFVCFLLVFIGIIGGTPVKRIPEGLF